MTKKILETIKKYEKKGDFNYAESTDAVLTEAQKRLGIMLPEQFIDYVKMFGSGGIGGISILGIGLDGSIMFEEETRDYRQYGLPENLVVIENIDEWLNCIDCTTGKIVSWDQSGFVKEESDCFDDYLMQQMHDVIDNLK
ncbi:MAG: SMI1/KNR4 family protein [Eubacteriales bacterium]|nr:SMI1/KNR4 family protein [Eubacteriales bacterium]